MGNRFHIIKYRCNVKESDILLVQGWFEHNEMENNEILILWNDRKLKYRKSERQGIEIRKKHLFDAGIDTEYYFWVKLPSDFNSNGIIRIFNIDHENKQLAGTILSSKVLKMQRLVDKYVESIVKVEERYVVKGWYVSPEPVQIFVSDMRGRSIPYDLNWNYRRDVVLEYPEAEEEWVKGFELTCQTVVHKIKIGFNTKHKSSQYVLSLKTSKAKTITNKILLFARKTIGYLKVHGIIKFAIRISEKIFRKDETVYDKWRLRHIPDTKELEKQRKRKFEYNPKISIVVPLYKTPAKYLDELIDSIKKQTYSNWELCLSDGSGDPKLLGEKLLSYGEDQRIKYVVSTEPLKIPENTNQALEIATGDFIAFADHDDLLTPDALYECVKVSNQDQTIDVMYSDEDKVTMNGKEFFQPHFKPDFNINLLCSMNYICHLFVARKSIVDQVGGLKPEFNGAQDYDFILRCIEKTSKIHHISKVLYHWRAHKDSTAENPESKLYAFEAGARAVTDHYRRVGIEAVAEQGEYLGLYKTRHTWVEKPLISIIIPNKDHIEDLDKCINSIETKSKYPNYEYIIIENNSTEDETFAYYEELQKKNSKVTVCFWNEKEFNYSAINNYGVGYAKGEFFLFLNNDTEIINADCLEELVGYCMHDDVGAVGARLYYEDDTIQHAGVIVGFGGVAGHAFIGKDRTENGYFSRIICAQNLSAVTAACMMVKKKAFEEVGGFCEELRVAFNDIDFCMKLIDHGYLVVYNPYAELYHYESKSRGLENTAEKVERFNSEIAVFQTHWPVILKDGDPYYNPNLSMDRCDFSLR